MHPVVLAAAVAGASLQDAKPLEFRSDVKLIRLDVSVVDGIGRPVAGLLSEDFEIREDGRPVSISYFEAFEPGSTAPALPAALGVRVSADRRILLLLDVARMSHGQLLRARDSASRFLREGTADGDWVRVANLANGRAWDGTIPEDRLRLSAAVRAMERGTMVSANGSVLGALEDRLELVPESGPSESETAGQFLSAFSEASGLLGTLEALIVQLGGVVGRKAIVLVSPGFPQIRDLQEHLEHVASLAREAATAIYFVDVAGLDGLLPEPGGRMRPAFEAAWARSGGSQDLAEATGGYTSRFSNTLVPALTRIGDEMRTYYVIGYAPTKPDDGRFRSVKVKVKVDGLHARTKKGYLARSFSR
jgi:VWFA-related protein